MPERSRHHRHHDDYNSDSDYDQHDRRGRDRARPRAQHRSSSFDEGYHYGHHPQRTRRYDEYGDSDHDISDYEVRRPSRTKTHRGLSRGRRTKSAGASRSRHNRSRSESRDWHEEIAREKKNQAIRSALTAGAMEAMRQRNRPGDWLGTKGVRVATAAISAAAIDTAVDRNPRKGGKTKLVTSALGGLFVDKLASSVRGRH